MREYQSYEFCKSFGCRVYENYPKDQRKPICKNCDAYAFHEYLQQQGFLIIHEAEEAVREAYVTEASRPEHHQAAEEIAALLDRKRADYGVENIRKFGSRGCMVRASDKIERLINLTWDQDRQPNHESIEDTWLDLAGYALLGLIELRQGR